MHISLSHPEYVPCVPTEGWNTILLFYQWSQGKYIRISSPIFLGLDKCWWSNYSGIHNGILPNSKTLLKIETKRFPNFEVTLTTKTKLFYL